MGKEVIVVDLMYFSPTEVDLLINNTTKSKNKLERFAENYLVSLVQDIVELDGMFMRNYVN
jgi:GDPmannose 4,6-dehydratase